MKSLNGAEIAGYMKLNQVHQVRSLQARGIKPKLVIIRDSNNPVIVKYVNLKKQYGEKADRCRFGKEFFAGMYRR